jgi:hypothetical protein
MHDPWCRPQSSRPRGLLFLLGLLFSRTLYKPVKPRAWSPLGRLCAVGRWIIGRRRNGRELCAKGHIMSLWNRAYGYSAYYCRECRTRAKVRQ